MTASTDYDRYRTRIAEALEPGFGFAEICRPGSVRHQLPPEKMWDRIIQPLLAANALRQTMMEKHGAKGLRCQAAFRPSGGAGNSMHKHNRALDLDLLPKDYHLTRQYYEEAVRLWCTYGRGASMGLGLYCRADACQGIRVHIDCHGYSYARTWQHGAKVGKADALIIAKRLGLELPTGTPATLVQPEMLVVEDESEEESFET